LKSQYPEVIGRPMAIPRNLAGLYQQEELDDTARAGLWPQLVAEAPTLGEHQARTARQIPVVMLTPSGAL
jgi:hypothetical protein